MYDLIGDIHGELGALETLLRKLGYRSTDQGWAHPGRTAVFLGDLIDRGADSRGVCRLVREMTGSGNALAVMGNHEFNALAFHTPDPEHTGGYLRRRTDKNFRQHEATLQNFTGRDSELAETLAWFNTLPVWLDLGALRVVHAAWHPEAMAALDGHLNRDLTLREDALEPMSREGHTAYENLETELKGVEVKLPEGCSFLDKDGQERHETRIRWWLPARRPTGVHWPLLADRHACTAGPERRLPRLQRGPPGRPTGRLSLGRGRESQGFVICVGEAGGGQFLHCSIAAP